MSSLVVAQTGVRPEGGPFVDHRPPGDRLPPGRRSPRGVGPGLHRLDVAGPRPEGSPPSSAARRVPTVRGTAGARAGRRGLRPLAVTIVLAVQRRWRRLALVAGAVSRRRHLRHRRSPPGPRGGFLTPSTAAPGWRHPASVAAVHRRARRRRDGGQPWMSRPWRRTADLALAVLVSRRHRQHLGCSSSCWRRPSGAAVGPDIFRAPNRRPATPQRVPCAAGRRHPSTRRGRPFTALHRRCRRRRTGLREGVRPRQPGR